MLLLAFSGDPYSVLFWLCIFITVLISWRAGLNPAASRDDESGLIAVAYLKSTATSILLSIIFLIRYENTQISAFDVFGLGLLLLIVLFLPCLISFRLARRYAARK
jgi:hypothetical protein